MNLLLGIHTAYQHFLPSAGCSLLFTIIALSLYILFAVIFIILYLKTVQDKDYSNYVFQNYRKNISLFGGS